MITDDFFDVDKNPKICLHEHDGVTTLENNVWTNCENDPNKSYCCSNENVNKIDSIEKFNEFKGKIKVWYGELKIPNCEKKKDNDKEITNANKKSIKDKIKKIIGKVDSLEVNHRLFKKQYDELIFSPNEVINVDKNINKFRYLELDRKLEKYDKKTYALYKNFFYIMLITSGIFFIRKQLKK